MSLISFNSNQELRIGLCHRYTVFQIKNGKCQRIKDLHFSQKQENEWEAGYRVKTAIVRLAGFKVTFELWGGDVSKSAGEKSKWLLNLFISFCLASISYFEKGFNFSLLLYTIILSKHNNFMFIHCKIITIINLFKKFIIWA